MIDHDPFLIEGSRIADDSAENERIKQVLRRITDRILTANGIQNKEAFDYDIHIMDTPETNGCVMPKPNGKTTFMYSKGFIMRAESEDQLATVISHELAHDDLQYMFSKHNLSYSMSDEIQADWRGYGFMIEAGYDIKEAQKILDKFSGHIPYNFDPHPAKAYRSEIFKKKIQELQGKGLEEELDRKPTPLPPGIHQDASRLKHTSYAERLMEEVTFTSLSFEEQMDYYFEKKGTRLKKDVEAFRKQHAHDRIEKLLGLRTGGVNHAMKASLKESYNPDNSAHKKLLEQYADKFASKESRNDSNYTFLENLNDYQHGQKIADQLDNALNDFIHAETKDIALSAAQQVSEINKKYSIGYNKLYRGGHTVSYAISLNAGYTLPHHPQFKLLTRAEVKEKLAANGEVKPPFAKHLEWLLEDRSEAVAFTLESLGVKMKDFLSSTIYRDIVSSFNYDHTASEISKPVSEEEPEEFTTQDLRLDDSRGVVSSLEHFTFSNNGTIISDYSKRPDLARLSQDNTQNITEEEYNESEQKRVQKLEQDHKHAVETADWQLFVDRPYKFVEQYAEYLSPELSVIERSGEVFPAALVQKLDDLIAQGSETHKHFAQRFFGNKGPHATNLTLNNYRSTIDFEAFLEKPLDTLHNQGFILSTSSDVKEKRQTEVYENDTSYQFRSKLCDFLVEEYFPNKEKYKHTQLGQLLQQAEESFVEDVFAVNLARLDNENTEEENLRRYKQELQSYRNSNGDYIYSLQQYKFSGRMFTPGITSNYSTDKKYLIRNEFITYFKDHILAPEINRPNISDLAKAYVDKNAKINASLSYPDGQYDEEGNRYHFRARFSVAIEHPFQKYILDDNHSEFSLGDKARAMKMSILFQTIEGEVGKNIIWGAPFPHELLGYDRPESTADLMALFNRFDLPDNTSITTLANHSYADMASAFNSWSKGLGDKDVSKSLIADREIKKQEATRNNLSKKILQSEAISFLERNQGAPIPHAELKEIIYLTKLTEYNQGQATELILQQAKANYAQANEQGLSSRQLLNIYNDYNRLGIFSDDIELRYDIEQALISSVDTTLDAGKQFEIAKSLLNSPTEQKIKDIANKPTLGVLVSSHSTIRERMAAEYTATQGSITSPKLRNWAENIYAKHEASKLGLDFGQNTQQVKDTVDEIHKTIRSSGSVRRITYQISTEIESQRELAFHIRDKDRDFNEGKNKKYSAGAQLFQQFDNLIYDNPALKAEMLEYLTSPHDVQKANQLISRHRGDIKYLAYKILSGQADEKRLSKLGISDRALNVENKLGAISDQAAANALYQFKENFWTLPLEARSAFMERQLFPEDLLTKEERQDVKFNVYNDMSLQETGEIFSSELDKFKRLNEEAILKLAEKLKRPPAIVSEQVNEKISHYKASIRAEKTPEIKEQLIEEAFADKENGEISKLIVKAYIDACPPEIAELMLSSLKVTDNPDIKTDNNLGKVLKDVLTSLEPAGVKVLQAIESNPTTPQWLKKELAESKTNATHEERHDIIENFEKYGPPQDGQIAPTRRVGKTLGIGSYGVTVINEKVDDTQTAVTILKPGSEKKANARLNEFVQAVNTIAAQRPELEPLRDIIVQAKAMAAPETDMDVSAKQGEQSAEAYNGMKVSFAGEDFTFSTAEYISYGLSHDKKGNIHSGYKETQIIEGQHFNDIAPDTSESKTRQKNLAKAILTSELSIMLSGKSFDHDRHGGQQRIIGNTIGNFDFGAWGPVKDGEIIEPTTEMKEALGQVIVSTMLNNIVRTGASKGLSHAIHSGVTNIVALSSKDQADALRGLPMDNAANAFFAKNVAMISASKINKLGCTPDVKNYLLSVQRGVLALGDYIKHLEPEDLKQVMGSVLKSGNVDPDIVAGINKGNRFVSVSHKGDVKVAGIRKVDLLKGMEPIQIHQPNKEREQGISYHETIKTEPSEHQLNFMTLKRDETKLRNDLNGLSHKKPRKTELVAAMRQVSEGEVRVPARSRSNLHDSFTDRTSSSGRKSSTKAPAKKHSTLPGHKYDLN